MKEGLHPTYNQTTITCACGNVLEVGSTKKDLKVDVCSKCHPYWTGNLRLDTKGGRADRFKKKYGLQEKNGFQSKPLFLFYEKGPGLFFRFSSFMFPHLPL